MSSANDRQLRVCVVGAGTRFMSGISVYTCRLTNAMAHTHATSAILMRQLLPTRLYPGRSRVGTELTQLAYDESVPVYDGVDWFWLPSLAKALAHLQRERPDIVVFQWWSGTVLHSYLALATMARLLGAKVVVEFHEVLDTAELRMVLARSYVGLAAPLFMNMADGFVVHSSFDLEVLQAKYQLGQRPTAIISHGPYDHYRSTEQQAATRYAPDGVCNLLFFGVIRPYKGLDDLINAFDQIPEDQIDNFWLTIVGETWEGYSLPEELIKASKYRDRISFINRYVHDDEVASFYAGADAVVLPYHRSSASGPLHVAMSYGLPVVTTHVGGLVEAAAGYEGAIMVAPQDPAALGAGIIEAARMLGRRYADPHSWQHTARRFDDLFATVMSGPNLAKELPSC